MKVTSFGFAGSATSITQTEFDSFTFGSPKPGTFTAPRSVCRSTPAADSALGKPKAGKSRPVSLACLAFGARNRLVLEHADVGDVELAAVGRKRQRERQPADPDRRLYLPGFCVDYSDPEIRLVDRIENSPGRIQRQIAGVAVVEALLVQVDRRAGARCSTRRG